MERDKNWDYGHNGYNPYDHHSQNFESFLNKDADSEARHTAEELRHTDSRRSPEDDRGLGWVTPGFGNADAERLNPEEDEDFDEGFDDYEEVSDFEEDDE